MITIYSPGTIVWLHTPDNKSFKVRVKQVCLTKGDISYQITWLDSSNHYQTQWVDQCELSPHTNTETSFQKIGFKS